MVPVHVGQEEIVFLRPAVRAAFQCVAAKVLETGTHVTDKVGAVPFIYLDAAGRAAVRSASSEIELKINEASGLFGIGKYLAFRNDERVDDLGSNLSRRRRYGKRAPSSPEAHDSRMDQSALPIAGSVSSTANSLSYRLMARISRITSFGVASLIDTRSARPCCFASVRTRRPRDDI